MANTTGVYLPAPPKGPGGEDSVETAGGTKCRQSINTNGAYVDLGVTASAASSTPRSAFPTFYSNQPEDQGLVYLRLTMPLGKKPERIDCSRLYELEILRLQEEIKLLRLAAE